MAMTIGLRANAIAMPVPSRRVRVATEAAASDSNGSACVFGLPDDLEEVEREDRREAEARFVEHEDPRLGHEAACDREHLLLAARERARELRAPLAETREEREDLVHGLAHRGARVRRR